MIDLVNFKKKLMRKIFKEEIREYEETIELLNQYVAGLWDREEELIEEIKLVRLLVESPKLGGENMGRYEVKQVDVGGYLVPDVKYGVYYYVENTGIHTPKDDIYSNLVVLCNTEFIADKVRELLELDNYIEENK